MRPECIRLTLALLSAVLGSLTLACRIASAHEVSGPAPLFADDSLLEVTIAAPLETLMRERPDVEYLDGTFSYRAPHGSTTTLDLKLRTRGNYRRDEEHCDFAPIRLNFRTSQVADTLLARQDKIKLVTHCRSDMPHFQFYVLREYLAYRFYHALTPISYAVRLLRITYVDMDTGHTMTRLGFVIEDDNAVAERNGLEVVKIARIPPADIDRRQQNLVHVFSYMVGNTEYSLVNPEPDKDCCHNADVLSETGGPPYLPLLFDFDFAGLVDAPYAQPNPRYPIHSVRTRHYKGLCTNNDLLPGTVQMFFETRDDFDRIIDSFSNLSGYSARLARGYLKGFFKSIRDPESVQKSLANKCYESDG
jgi:hypothetical protein